MTCDCQGDWEWERVGLGVWDQQIQSIIYRMGKLKGPIV